MVWKPRSVLALSDMFRLSGDRTYTEFAITSTIVSGVVLILMGIFLIVLPFTFQ